MDGAIYSKWLRFYNLSREIDNPVKYYDEAKTKRLPFSQDSFNDFIKEVDVVLKSCGAYLDKHGYKIRKPLWKYDSKDETTWASSPKFAYGHLL